NRPHILLLDEITSSLDKGSQQDIEQLIERINATYETTIIWITHNLRQAREIGDYLCVMVAGEMVESGEPSLLDSPKTMIVRRFVEGEIESIMLLYYLHLSLFSFHSYYQKYLN